MSAPTTHRVRWYGILPGARGTLAEQIESGDAVPRNRRMNGGDWGWDAVCSCGFATHTGGAIQERIRDEIAAHRFDVERGLYDAEAVR